MKTFIATDSFIFLQYTIILYRLFYAEFNLIAYISIQGAKKVGTFKNLKKI